MWSNYTGIANTTIDWKLDLGYIDGSGNIIYENITKGESIGNMDDDFATLTGTSISDFEIDSNSKIAAFCYIDGNGVYATDSTDLATPELIVSNSEDKGDPDVLLNENDIITALYVQNQTGGDSKIMVADNVGSTFDNLDALLTFEEIPAGINPDVFYCSSFDAEFSYGEGVAIIYDAVVQSNSEREIYINGYGNIYGYDGGFNYYSWEEILGGKITQEPWLLEAIQISYNTTAQSDMDLMVRITDEVTNVTWNNVSSINGEGGEVTNITFFQPDNYFIAQNDFTVEILNGSNQENLMRIDIDPLDLTYIEEEDYNYSSNNFINGTYFPYRIKEAIGEYFTTIFYFEEGLSDDEVEERDTISQSDGGKFKSYNVIDFYKFYMQAGEQYNMSLTATGDGAENCRIMIFNSSNQITDPAKALYVNTTASFNESYFTFYADTTDTYFITIENTKFGEEYDYTFIHKVCPMTANLIYPAKGKYLNQEEIEFTWGPNDEEDGVKTPETYFLRVYDENYVMKYEDEFDSTITAYNLTVIGGAELDLNDGIYYWTVQISSSDGLKSKEIFQEFRLDTTPPNAPMVYTPEGYFQIGQFRVNWTEPSDAPFNVDYYELYRGSTSDFQCTPNNKISIGDTLKSTSYWESNMDSEVYYYKVIAVDNVGLKSEPSNAGRYVVAISGYPDPLGQNFQVLAGDFLEYQFVDVYDEDTKDPSELYANFNGRSYQVNTLIRFWLSDVSSDAVIPVRGNLYKKSTNTTAQQAELDYTLVGKEIDIFPLVTSPDTDYQKEVFDVFLARNFEGKTFSHQMKESQYFDTFQAIDVVVHSYSTDIDYDKEKISDINFEYDSAIFVVDKNTGVVLELTIYNSKDNQGYGLKLVETNIELSTFNFIWIPFIIIAVLGIIAAIINQIVKKLERRL